MAKKVLVAEDDKFLVQAYKAKVAKAGLEAQFATDGEEALKLLETFKPDVVLLDLIMPKKDGFAVLTEIQANSQLKNIPVLVASNLGQKEDIDKAKAQGARDFIVKTDVPLSEIITKINSY